MTQEDWSETGETSPTSNAGSLSDTSSAPVPSTEKSFGGNENARVCSDSTCIIASRIHQTAYVMNFTLRDGSNRFAASIRPRLPS